MFKFLLPDARATEWIGALPAPIDAQKETYSKVILRTASIMHLETLLNIHPDGLGSCISGFVPIPLIIPRADLVF